MSPISGRGAQELARQAAAAVAATAARSAKRAGPRGSEASVASVATAEPRTPRGAKAPTTGARAARPKSADAPAALAPTPRTSARPSLRSALRAPSADSVPSTPSSGKSVRFADVQPSAFAASLSDAQARGHRRALRKGAIICDRSQSAVFWPAKQIYVGPVNRHGAPHGTGMVHLADGRVLRSEWSGGVPHKVHGAHAPKAAELLPAQSIKQVFYEHA